jgi:hypothetical protein
MRITRYSKWTGIDWDDISLEELMEALSDAAFNNGIKPEDYGKCIHKVKVKGNNNAYEAGIVNNPQGAGYLIVWDFWGPGEEITKAMGGQDGGALIAQYTRFASIKSAIEQGYSVSESVDEFGNYVIEAEEYVTTGY